MKKIKFLPFLFAILAMVMACNGPIIDPPITNVTNNGIGTETDPYTVAGALKKNNGDAFVKAYIVGFMSLGDVNTPTFTSDADTVNTNIIVADSIGETVKILPVQLPFGEIRNALNLVDNKDVFQKEVLLYGQITPYFGQTGLKSVTYAKIGDNEFGFNPNKPIETVGKGTKEEPYTYADIEKIINRGTEVAYVKAFIVGQVKGGEQAYNESTAEFAAPFTPTTKTDGSAASYNTNILIGATAEANTVAEASPVQLPSGAVRMGLNLCENPSMLGKEVILYGSIEKYFGAAGIKSVTYAIVEGKEYGTEPVSSDGAILFESFETSLGGFKVVDITKGTGITNIWTHDAKYKCAKATGYGSTKQDGEGWLVSPAIDLTKVSSATLTFDNAGNFFVDAAQELTVWISSTSDGTSFNEGWNQLEVDKYSVGNFAFTSSTIDLTAHCGNSVRIAFKYISTPTMCGTWEIQNFMVK